MTYKEKKRSLFLGLPWTFTSYTVTDEIITIDSGLLKKEENDCYLYKVIDVRLEIRILNCCISGTQKKSKITSLNSLSRKD